MPVAVQMEQVRSHESLVAVLALSLGLVMSAFAGPEFESASAVERMYETG
ncbi:hypothetical protein Mycsm_05348 [Mycobacterium sp. JS623]|nr:hypothetical protein [Mycobacterium sp. JS623]AGB25540.1 hypothetical protein Mycsm_05348 [Mycobacterium sp. JS623]